MEVGQPRYDHGKRNTDSDARPRSVVVVCDSKDAAERDEKGVDDEILPSKFGSAWGSTSDLLVEANNLRGCRTGRAPDEAGP